MGLQITIFVSVLIFTSLVPHRKKIRESVRWCLPPLDGAPPFRLCNCLHSNHNVSLYHMCTARRSVLGKTNKGRITTTYCEPAGSRLRPEPLRPCGYCMGITNPRAARTGPGMWLSHGRGPLDIVAHNGHINDDRHDNGPAYY